MSHHPTRQKPLGVRVWRARSEDRPCLPHHTPNRRVLLELPGWYLHATKGWRKRAIRMGAA